MYWKLTRQPARDNWLLTGWRESDQVRPEVMLTPYIEFEDGAQLAEFLRQNNHKIVTSQPSTVLWLVANGLHEIGRKQSAEISLS
jgi:hypothetical protein